VLLHGFPEFWYGWRKQIPALAEAGCRVIVPDQRGYNLSDKPKGIRAYRVEELVADVVGLIDALEYERVNVVGHDWGAIVAWMLAIRHPDRLHRLGIVNVPHPAVIRQFLRRDPEQMVRSWYAAFFQLPGLPELSLRLGRWRGASLAMRRSATPNAFTDEDMEKYRAAWSQPGAMTAMLNWYRAAARYRPRITNEMQVHVPALILWGVKDVALTYRMARPSLDYCDKGNLIFFPDATHWVQHEEVDEVNRHLLSLISS
jgi:pimeloyl-ACP methyl ester carboxylesterase